MVTEQTDIDERLLDAAASDADRAQYCEALARATAGLSDAKRR